MGTYGRPIVKSVLALVLCGSVALVSAHEQQPNSAKATGVVSGRVLDTTSDAPVAGAIVRITAVASRDRLAAEPGLYIELEQGARNVMTAADGSFEFRNLEPGRYSVVT